MSSNVRHHADGATLMGFAAGTLSEPLAAVVAAHLSMCPDCRADVADLELLGATLMLAPSSTPAGTALKAPRRPVDVPVAAPMRRHQTSDRLPASLTAAYGLTLANIPWKRLGPGVWHHRLSVRSKQSGDLRLLRIAPGSTMPDHGHGGAELTLVIEGAYHDATGTYRRGDIQDVDESIEHQPIVATGAECICLIASERPARFKTLAARLTQPWTKM